MTSDNSASLTDSAIYVAQHDPVTGLPNKHLLQERLTQAIALARRHDRYVAVLSLNLDNFKATNVALRHVSGEYALQLVAGLLTGSVRETDTVCYVSDDEFMILLTQLENPQDTEQVAQQLLAAFTESLGADQHSLHITLCIATSIYPQDGESAINLLQHADKMLRHYKLSPGYDAPTETVSTPPSAETAPSRASAKLQQALDNGEFVLHYQPQFDLTSGQLSGVEALLRWDDPERGLVYPPAFMPLAEACGLMIPIGQWVLQETCKQINVWKAAGMARLPFAINVCAREFHQSGFADRVSTALWEAGLLRGDIELELAEQVLAEDRDQVFWTLNALKAIGVRLAIDGFGTGDTSLRDLRDLPFDTIKVDRFFLLDIESNPDEAIFFRSLIRLGKNLDRRIVVTGVENVQQLAFLQAQHCDKAQGYQLGRPLPTEEFGHLLANRPFLMPNRQLH